MALLSSGDNNVRYGVVVDIGSGSVLASIIESDSSKTYPHVVWSKREYSPLRQVDSLNRTVKSIMTSLISVLMILDSEGRTALRDKAPKAKISFLQFTIAAPWSYTVAKTISYKNETEFDITEDFISELLRMAEQKVLEELKNNEQIHNLGLSIISRVTADVIANGYSIDVNGKQKSKSVKVIELSAITHDNIVQEIDEVQDKMFPKTELTQYSFMMAFFYTILDLYPDIMECCLVDVTYEATEIGVVRDGTLQYCTHIPYGAISIAREISTILSVPLEEAYGYLKQDNFDLVLEKYSERQKSDISAVFNSYKERLVKLFHETGDKLSIPKGIFLHSDLTTSSFFKKILIESASVATKSSHVVYNVTSDLLTKNYSKEEQDSVKNKNQDTAMLISAQFFHTHNYAREFEQL
jgi:cell division ATPase FtsA